MIYMTFDQWADGNFLETGEPRKKAYSQAELDLVEMGWNYGYDAGVQWQKIQQALPKREWQGLTDDEVSKLIDNEIGFNSCCGWEEEYTRAVEAKLKEKNHDQ